MARHLAGHHLGFAGPIGDPIYPETVSRSFKELVEKLDLPTIRLHDLRHTWATLALTAGVHPKVGRGSVTPT